MTKYLRIKCLFAIVCISLLSLLEAGHHETEKDPATILKRTSNYLYSLEEFRLHVSDSVDSISPSGQKIELHHTRVMTVKRPDRLHVKVSGDEGNRITAFDGQDLFIYFEDENVFAKLDGDGSRTIEELLELIHKTFLVQVPASDLIAGELFPKIEPHLESTTYIGTSHINGVECHHILIQGERADWQLWIQTSDPPVLRKASIYYKLKPRHPKYTMTIDQLELVDGLEEDDFELKIPEDAEEMDVYSFVEAREEEDTEE